MKKYLFFIVAFILPLCTFANTEITILNGTNEPEWKDFAPTAFVDVKEPKGFMGKMNVTAKYWYERRVAFEDGLLECKMIDSYEERFNCFEQLKIKQFKENTDYNARIEAKMNASAGVSNSYDRTDAMIPINNYINTFSRYMPNEFQ